MTKSISKKPTLTAKHTQALEGVLDRFGRTRFRRSDVAAAMYPLTTPRDRQRADELAGQALRQAQASGRIRREGHLHWIRTSSTRTLLDGRVVPELDKPVVLGLETKCPGKWLSVDMETGQVWERTATTWKAASPAAMAALRLIGTHKREAAA